MDRPQNEEAMKIAARLEEIAEEAASLRQRFNEICEANGIDKRSVPFYDEPEKICDWVSRHGFTWTQYVSGKRETPKATLEILYDRYERKASKKPRKNKRKDKPFLIHDEKFLSLDDFAERMGIEKSSVYCYASRNGVDVMEECRRIYEKKRIPLFYVDRQPFFTKRDISTALGINYDRLCRYINAHKRKKHFTEDEIRTGIVRKPVSSVVRTGKEVRIDGHVWLSQSAFARDMGYSSITSIYTYAKAHGMTPSERIVEVYHGINCRKRGSRKGGVADGSRSNRENQRDDQAGDVQES